MVNYENRRNTHIPKQTGRHKIDVLFDNEIIWLTQEQIVTFGNANQLSMQTHKKTD